MEDVIDFLKKFSVVELQNATLYSKKKAIKKTSIYNRTKLGRTCVSRRGRLRTSKRAPGASRCFFERRSFGLGAPENLLAAPRAAYVVPYGRDVVVVVIKSGQRQRGRR